MSQPNLLHRAKQGNPDAIAALMNLTLQDKDVIAEVVRIQDCLHISFSAAKLLNQATLLEFARLGLERLEVKSIQMVNLYGLKTNQEQPNWVVSFQLGALTSAEAQSKDRSPLRFNRVGFRSLQDRGSTWLGSTQPFLESFQRMSEKYQIRCTRPLNPPILGDFRSNSPQNWGVRGAVRATSLTSQTSSQKAAQGVSAKVQALLSSVRPKFTLPHPQEILPPGISLTVSLAIAAGVTIAAFLVGSLVAGMAISHGEKSSKLGDRQSLNSAANLSYPIPAQQAQVKQYLSKMIATQKLFYQQNLRLTKNLEELERSAAVVSHSYSYTYRVAAATPTQFELVAIAKTSGLKSYTAIVTVIAPSTRADPAAIVTGLCETNQPAQVPPIVVLTPINEFQCAAGSSKTH